MVKQISSTRPTLRSSTVKKTIAKCETSSQAGITTCKKSLCENMREIPVKELRALAKLLGVPQSACIKREYLCEAIDSQIVTFFSLKQFSDGSKNLQQLVKEFIQKSGKDGSNLKKENASKMADALLKVLLLTLENYNQMIEIAFQVSMTNKKDRNKKLITTANETNIFLRSALLGVGGSFLDATYFRKI